MTLTQINKAGLDEIALDHVFTIGASGNSAYTFQGEGLNGTVNNPTLYLTRGKTYRFENGSGGHPIRIQSTSGASGTAYNTGVTNNAGSGTVIVEVQHDAPDVLYYQCTSHAAMNGILYITGALADGGVTTAKLAAGAVDNTKIASSTIQAANIAPNAIVEVKIADGAVANAKLTSNAVSTIKIQDDAVTQAKIAAGAVGNTELASGAVSAAKIDTDAVTTAKIADDAVTSDKIADNAIGQNLIQTGAVETAKLGTQAVTTAKIADQAVTLDKLPHGTSSNDGKFLRANNGADPTFETVTGTTINNNNAGRVITGSGTANTLEGNTKFTFAGDLVKAEKRMVIGNGTEFQIPSRSGTSSYTPQLQVTGAWNNPTHGGTLALNGRNDYPILWINSGATYATNSGSGTVTFSIKDSSGDYCNTAEIRAHVDASPSNDNAPGRLSFYTTGDSGASAVERLRIDKDGNVFHQNASRTYAASYRNLSNNHSNAGMNGGNETLLFTTALSGMGNTNQYNTSNGRYTAPVKGYYLVQFRGLIDNSRNTNNSSSVWIYKNGSQTYINMYYEQVNYALYRAVSGSSILPLEANDYITLHEAGTGALHVSTETQMAISLYRAHL